MLGFCEVAVKHSPTLGHTIALIMSEFAPTIAQQPITNGAPIRPMGAENFSGFSSKGMFKDIRSNSSEGIIDINNGMGKDSEFQRSESFESQAQDSQSLFDTSNPYQEQGIGNFDQPTQSTETSSIQSIEEPANVSRNKDKEFTDMLSNSTVLWESPTSKLKGYGTQEVPAQRVEKPTLLKENAEHSIQSSAGAHIETSNKGLVETTAVPEGHAEASPQQEAATTGRIVTIPTESEQTPTLQAPVETMDQKKAEATQTQPEGGISTQTETENTALSQSQPETNIKEKSKTITNGIAITEINTKPTTAPQLQPEVRTQTETTTTTTALEAVREEVRLMPDTKEVTVTLTQPLPELQKQTKTQVMDKEALEKILATEKVQKTKAQTEKEIDTKATPTMKGEEAADPEKEDEDETTIKITKAWFEEDVVANKNRRLEIVKAYALVHYKWLRQYISRIDGSTVADTIKKHRDREKLESQSIKRIQRDGSVDPFAETIEKAKDIEALDELDSLLDDAEREFSGTNFTAKPTQEIMDGEQIDRVHNGEEEFYANLDGEEVKVIMNGARNAKKPTFIRVEME